MKSFILALAAVVAAATGIVAGQSDAAPPAKPDKGSCQVDEPKFKEPKLKHGELRIKGTDESDTVALRLQAGLPGVIEIDVGDDGSADFSFDRASVAAIDVDARDGDDIVRIDESQGAFTDAIPTTIDGGNGDDTLTGGKGIETFAAGDGNDTIDGNGGNDSALMGSGDDTFVWDPGDGSDTLEGQDGADVMVFNGAGGPEQVELSANGNRLRFFRTQATITMDTAGVEGVDFNALGGADTVTVDDLTGTDVTDLRVNLAVALGGVAGDAAADRVVVNATGGDDVIAVSGAAGAVNVSGLDPRVRILHAEAANDRLEINTLAGTDTVGSGGLAAGAIQLFVDNVLIP